MFNVDYIFVIDMEGLKFLELLGNFICKYDNELFIFVIGLSSFVLIKLLGEDFIYL